MIIHQLNGSISRFLSWSWSGKINSLLHFVATEFNTHTVDAAMQLRFLLIPKIISLLQCKVGSEVKVRVGGDFFYDPQPKDSSHNLLLLAGGNISNYLISRGTISYCLFFVHTWLNFFVLVGKFCIKSEPMEKSWSQSFCVKLEETPGSRTGVSFVTKRTIDRCWNQPTIISHETCVES